MEIDIKKILMAVLLFSVMFASANAGLRQDFPGIKHITLTKNTPSGFWEILGSALYSDYGTVRYTYNEEQSSLDVVCEGVGREVCPSLNIIKPPLPIGVPENIYDEMETAVYTKIMTDGLLEGSISKLIYVEDTKTKYLFTAIWQAEHVRSSIVRFETFIIE